MKNNTKEWFHFQTASNKKKQSKILQTSDLSENISLYKDWESVQWGRLKSGSTQLIFELKLQFRFLDAIASLAAGFDCQESICKI